MRQRLKLPLSSTRPSTPFAIPFLFLLLSVSIFVSIFLLVSFFSSLAHTLSPPSSSCPFQSIFFFLTSLAAYILADFLPFSLLAPLFLSFSFLFFRTKSFRSDASHSTLFVFLFLSVFLPWSVVVFAGRNQQTTPLAENRFRLRPQETS